MPKNIPALPAWRRDLEGASRYSNQTSKDGGPNLASAEKPPRPDAVPSSCHNEDLKKPADNLGDKGEEGEDDEEVRADEIDDEVRDDEDDEDDEEETGGNAEEKTATESEDLENNDESDIPFDNPFNYTQEELTRISAIEKECLELFPPDREKFYENKQALKKAFQELIGDKYGFYISIVGTAMRCNRCHLFAAVKKQQQMRNARTPVEKRRKRKSFRCGCKFEFFTKLKKVGKAKPDFSGPVCITKVNYIHSHGCSGKNKKIYTQSNEKKLSLDELHDMKVQRLGVLVNPHKDSEEKAKKLHTTEMVNYFRPMFRALASHPQQRLFLNMLDGIKSIVEGNTTDEDSSAASRDVREKIMLFGMEGSQESNSEKNAENSVHDGEEE